MASFGIAINLNKPAHLWTKEDYAVAIREFTTAYNQPIWTNDNLQGNIPLNPVDLINRNYQYYYSEQKNNRNYWATQDSTLNLLQSKNNNIYRLVNFLEGKGLEFITRFNVSTEIISKEAFTLKEQMLNNLMFEFDNREYFMALEQLGLFGSSLPEGEVFDSRDDVMAYVDMTFREFGGVTAERIAKEIIERCEYNTLKILQLKDIIIAGYCSTDRQIVNGSIKEFRVAPQECILDLRNPNDNNRNDAARFRGRFVNLSSPFEILERYGDSLDDDAKREIEQIAKSTDTTFGRSFLNTYPQSPTGCYDWYSLGQGNGSPVNGLSVVTMNMYVKCDYRNKIRKGKLVKERDYDKDGNPIAPNINRMGIHMNDRVIQGTLIGGKWVVNTGLVQNSTYSPYLEAKQEMPQTVYIHDYQAGYYKSMVTRMIDLQEDINLCDLLIKKAQLNGAKGIKYVFNASRGIDKTIKEIYQDWEAMDITALKVNIDDDENENRQPLLEKADFTDALKVIPFFNGLKDRATKELENMMHLPDVATGLQQSTIGKGVQQNTVALAQTGIMPLFLGFANFVQKDVQLSANIQKIIMLDPSYPKDKARMILGDRGYEWLLKTREMTFQYLGIYINPYDVIDTENRKILDSKLFNYSQGGIIDPEVDIKLSQMTSFKEAINFLERYMKKRRIEAQKLHEQQRMDNLAIADAGLQEQKRKTDATVEAMKYGDDRKAQATEYSANLSKEAKDNQTAVNAAKVAKEGSNVQ